jgi:class 3 adenylate cyclase/CHASE2 domain-containing sensor protein
MRVSKRQRRAIVITILIGLAATTVVLAAYARGALDRLELITLDLRFRHTNSIEPSDRIVCLDITDRDLELIGRWPWPRDLQAPLVAVPAEFGARAILVDLTWTEPETERSIPPEHADILTGLEELTRGEPPKRAFPDLVLGHAIASAGNVYLAYHHSVVDLERSEAFHELVNLLLRDETLAATRLASEIDRRLRQQLKNDQDYALQRPLDRALIVAALMRDPTLDVPQLAERLALGRGDFLERAFERCRDVVLRWKVAEWLDAQPERWQADPDELIAELYGVLTGRDFIGENPLMDAVIRAYREVLSYAATTAKPLAPLARLARVTRAVDGITPVHFVHARAARRCCFANFEPDLDGTVRRVALVERHGGNLLGQLGFSVGWDLLGTDADRVAAEPGRLTLTPTDASHAAVVVQLDDRGRAVIPWVRGREWTRQFQHLPASAVLELYDHRRNLAHNRGESAALLQLVFSSEFLPEFNELADLLAERPEVEQQAEWERLQGDAELAAFFNEQLEKIDQEAARGERRLRDLVARAQEDLDQETPPAGVLSPRIVDDLRYYLGQLDLLHDARDRIDREIENMTARLPEYFQDKICVVGYAATSLADMKPIPTHPSAPGLMAHASLLNGLLTGQLVRWATLPQNMLIAVAFGVVTTFIAAFLRPRLSLLLVVFAVVSYVAIGGALAFYRWAYWLALTPAVTATVLCYVLIAVYRYIFVEGERRQLATALGQYTSKEMARQMAENPELCRKAEMREVTAVFTDLKDFTGISERIGAKRTQEVLNVCLGRFTEVMLRYEGMVNKFIGDGIFAFWNPVIYPQDDHARRACRAAIDLLAAVDKLKTEQRRGGGDAVFDEIVLRIGIATGNAIVGPCGSEQKYDYTCIGDSVNVAARLESANKFYGTQILVNDMTRAQVADEFEFRPLGGVRVKGRQAAVPIYELLDRAGHVAADILDHAHAFGQAVTLFQERQWQPALNAFEACLRRRPADLAAKDYLEAATQYLNSPPADDWTGALELTEK